MAEGSEDDKRVAKFAFFKHDGEDRDDEDEKKTQERVEMNDKPFWVSPPSHKAPEEVDARDSDKENQDVDAKAEKDANAGLMKNVQKDENVLPAWAWAMRGADKNTPNDNDEHDKDADDADDKDDDEQIQVE